MKYRKKPVVIEAYHLGGIEPTPEWYIKAMDDGIIIPQFNLSDGVYIDIKTLEGTMRGNKDDYIIQGVKGEIYPCKPDIFEATYEECNVIS